MITTLPTHSKQRPRARTRASTSKRACTRSAPALQGGLSLFSGYFAQRLGVDPKGKFSCQKDPFEPTGCINTEYNLGGRKTSRCKNEFAACKAKGKKGRGETRGYDLMEGGQGDFVTRCYCVTYEFLQCKMYNGSDKKLDGEFFPVYRETLYSCIGAKRQKRFDRFYARYDMLIKHGTKAECRKRWKDRMPLEIALKQLSHLLPRGTKFYD